ncbi:hypothetical protein ACFWAP_00490 [Streptomyces goshikiensis]|uniref:hypothetical protein n=1 Tax=Streptomyces goshikiensis TaxID=1942 RepID=UPI0036637324
MRNPIRLNRSAVRQSVKPAPVDPNGRIPGERFTVAFVMTGAVSAILLAFGFDFGNVWALAARLGVPERVQPLTAPAVTISYLALMVGQQYLALRGWSHRELLKPRLWLLLIGAMTYALNCGDAYLAGAYGEAAFDAVMPTLLLMWGELAPWIMRQVHTARERATTALGALEPTGEQSAGDDLSQMVEELRAELWAREVEDEARSLKRRGKRPETPLRPSCREFVWAWLDQGKTYEDRPAAAWHKELVEQMGESAPTVVRCRQLMRDEFGKIEGQWLAAKHAEENADEVIERIEEALAS